MPARSVITPRCVCCPRGCSTARPAALRCCLLLWGPFLAAARESGLTAPHLPRTQTHLRYLPTRRRRTPKGGAGNPWAFLNKDYNGHLFARDTRDARGGCRTLAGTPFRPYSRHVPVNRRKRQPKITRNGDKKSPVCRGIRSALGRTRTCDLLIRSWTRSKTGGDREGHGETKQRFYQKWALLEGQGQTGRDTRLWYRCGTKGSLATYSIGARD